VRERTTFEQYSTQFKKWTFTHLPPCLPAVRSTRAEANEKGVMQKLDIQKLNTDSHTRFSTNEKQNQKQLHLVRAIFSAFWASYGQFLGVLIGSSCCLLLSWLARVIISVLFLLESYLKTDFWVGLAFIQPWVTVNWCFFTMAISQRLVLSLTTLLPWLPFTSGYVCLQICTSQN